MCDDLLCSNRTEMKGVISDYWKIISKLLSRPDD